MSELPNVQENNEQILNNIQSLQQMEQQLLSSLESNPNMTPEQQQSIVEKMNQEISISDNNKSIVRRELIRQHYEKAIKRLKIKFNIE
jgi:uncharacterized membrane protein YgaE (UPF0421/DUF939 family)